MTDLTVFRGREYHSCRVIIQPHTHSSENQENYDKLFHDHPSLYAGNPDNYNYTIALFMLPCNKMWLPGLFQSERIDYEALAIAE
jgi:hypothetical protein